MSDGGFEQLELAIVHTEPERLAQRRLSFAVGPRVRVRDAHDELVHMLGYQQVGWCNPTVVDSQHPVGLEHVAAVSVGRERPRRTRLSPFPLVTLVALVARVLNARDS